MKNFRTCLKGLGVILRPIRGKVAVSCLLGVVNVACSMAFVWVCKLLVDIATGRVDKKLLPFILLMVGIMLVQRFTAAGMSWWEGRITVRAQNENRIRFFEKVMRSTWDGKDKMHSGDTVNRLEEDIRVSVSCVCSNYPQAIVTTVQLIAAAAYMFILQPKLAWILVIIMPVAVIASKVFFRRLRELTDKIRKGDSLVQQHIQENLQHRILVRSLGATERVLEKMGALQADVEDNTRKRLNYGAVARIFISLGFMCGYALVFIWSVYGISKGTITFGMMTAFLQLVGQVQRPVADLSRHVPAFIHALTSAERLIELDELSQEAGCKDVRLSGAPGVRVENLRFTYPGGKEPVLDGFSHYFAPGSSTAIMGPTGAGKSTLIRLILSLLEADGGSVSLVDADGTVYPSDASTRCNYMFVPQGNSLLSGTIRQNLLMADPAADDGRLREALHLAAADFVFELPEGLGTVCSEKGSGLSEGQCQRISIARALLREGGVLVLDEATSALDAETEQTLLERVSAYCKGKRTVICITHRDAAAKFTDDCVVMG